MPQLTPMEHAPPGVARKQMLALAHHHTMRRHERRAIALYREVLIETPGDVNVSLRLAPLLARRGEDFESWRLYSDAGRRLVRAGRHEQALSVFNEACRLLPHNFDTWRIRAEIELKLGYEDAAFETLIEARHHFRTVHTRAQAIALLTMARRLEPWDVGVLLDLARLYAQTDQVPQALELLAAVGCRAHGATKRHIRGAQLRITYSPQHLWLYLRALWGELTGADGEAHDPRVATDADYADIR